MNSLTVVTPCFNEEENLEDCVAQVLKILNGISFEHIFIDNASTDSSVAVLKNLKKRYPHIRILQNSQNVGVFSSMQRALKVIDSPWVIPFFAADQQDPAEIILEMIKIQEKTKCDSVFGVRASRVEKKWLLALRSIFYRVLKNNSSGSYVSGTSEFCLIRSEVAQQLTRIEDPNPFLRIYLSQLRGNVEYVNFQMQERQKGKSSANLYTLVDDALNAFSIILPSVFSRLLVNSILGIAFGISLLGVSLIDLLFLPFHFEKLSLIGLVISGFSFLVGLNAVVGHYVYIIHNQIRKKLTIETTEISGVEE
jgi:glycosyltransferase involved in cell wall biosynthesis